MKRMYTDGVRIMYSMEFSTIERAPLALTLEQFTDLMPLMA